MNVFAHTDYRDLIDEALTKVGRGAKVKLAETLNCNPGYISQVLKKDKIHFSAENMIKISNFLKFSNDEEDFLLNLLHFERAGSQELKKFWEKKIKLAKEKNSKVEKQIKNISNDLSDTAKAIYYSHWAYSAIHMIVSINTFREINHIADHLKISKSLCAKILAFLEEHQLITKTTKGYTIGNTRIHLKANSPLVRAHHQNFRHKAIQTLEEENDFDIHYSAALTLSKKDALKIRQLLLKFIADKEEILIPSPNEEIIGLNLDLFKF